MSKWGAYFMIEIYDYSNRRGILVPMLPKMYEIITKNATLDKMAGIAPPEHIITWQHRVKKELTDLSRRFIVAMDCGTLAGFLFYRYQGGDVYIEELQIAWIQRNKPQILDGFLKKLELDAGTENALFYVNDRIKTEASKEILASVGLREKHEGGWECLGDRTATSTALRIRYIRA